MLRYQWRDASPNTDGPIKSLPCDVKWRSLQVIFWKYFQSGLTKKLWKNNCNLAAVDNFSKLHMCLFTFWMNRFFSLSFVQCSVSRNVLSSGHIKARLRSFISSVILPSSLSYVPCTVLKFRALDRFPGINVPGIFYSRNSLNWVLTALFHPLANV